MDIWKRLETQDKLIETIQLKLLGKIEMKPNQLLEDKLKYLEKRVDQLTFRVLRREVPSTAFKMAIEKHIIKVLRANGFSIEERDPVAKATEVAYRDELIRTIISAVERRWHCGILNRNTKRSASHARHVAAYLMREMTTLSYPEIGVMLDRDHSSVIHGYNKIKSRVLTEPTFTRMIVELRLQIDDSMKHKQPAIEEKGRNVGDEVTSGVDMLATRT